MPVYICNSKPNAVSVEASAKIAKDVTRIHCAVTGAPTSFVHVFFVEDADTYPRYDKGVLLMGSIRSGRTQEQKNQLATEMAQSIHDHTGVPVAEIAVVTQDTPASWVMEGGEIFPEPGEEAAWLAQQEAKHAAVDKDQ
ncbi:MAG: tautomerase family protein [Pseudomonadota bacterium]